jgi:hypothetical protein
MSNSGATAPLQFRPESLKDFSQRSRRLSKWLGLPYQRAQELLSRIYGYSNLHDLQAHLQRPGAPGPFDFADRPLPDREVRIARLIAECKGIEERELTRRDRAVVSMGLFCPPGLHRSKFKLLATRTKEDQKALRRVVSAPPPSHPSLSSVVLDVECSEGESIEWFWTETVEGRFVSGYALVPREQEQMEEGS